MAFKQTRPLVEQLSAKTRAEILGREAEAALDAGEFRFKRGVGFFHTRPDEKPCGCAIGAVLFGLGGRLGSETVHETLFSTGLVTPKEVDQLEQGYEAGSTRYGKSYLVKDGPFFRLGCRLRRRSDADPNWEQK